MASNGRFSCSKRTKHIKNRYFMIKDKIGKGEIIIQYCPTGNIWADINTKALQGILFYKMRARLMGIDENYHNDLERLATHPDLLPQETQECAISDENKELLHKAGAICTLMAAKKQGLHTSTQNTQAAVAALIFMKSMVRGTGMSSSHRRSVLGDKGCALRTVDKSVDKGISRGPDPCPLDERITDRRARIRDKDRTRTGIDRVRAIQCFVLSSRC